MTTATTTRLGRRRPRQAAARARADPRLHARRGGGGPRSPARWRCSPTPRTCSPTPGRSALALAAARLAARPPRGASPSASGRAEILSAQVNGATLLVLGRRDRLRGRAPADRPARRRGRRSCSPSACSAPPSTSAPRGRSPAPSAARSTSRAPAPHVLTDLYASLGAALAGAARAAVGFDARPTRSPRCSSPR